MRSLHYAIAGALPAFAVAAATATAAQVATHIPAPTAAQAAPAVALAISQLAQFVPLPVRVVVNGRVFYIRDILGYVSTSF